MTWHNTRSSPWVDKRTYSEKVNIGIIALDQRMIICEKTINDMNLVLLNLLSAPAFLDIPEVLQVLAVPLIRVNNIPPSCGTTYPSPAAAIQNLFIKTS